MKTISVLIPTFNEDQNVIPLTAAIIEQFEKYLPQYDYTITYIDNDSTDNTRAQLRQLCADNKRVRAIFNAKNFGQFNSPFHGLRQMDGDCTVTMCADFQDPVELIPRLVAEWEKGYKIVCAIKTKSKENPIMRAMRNVYYHLIKKFSSVDQIENFTGTGLYDKSFIEVLRNLDDPTPFMRGIVAELGFKRKEIEYTQQKRRAGKTSNNLYTLYDAAMLSFTSYTKIGMRLATFIGFFTAAVSLVVAFVYLILKLTHWQSFSMGNAPILIGVFVLGGMQMLFMGLLGEYILSINQRSMRRPLVIEEERINFDTAEDKT